MKQLKALDRSLWPEELRGVESEIPYVWRSSVNVDPLQLGLWQRVFAARSQAVAPSSFASPPLLAAKAGHCLQGGASAPAAAPPMLRALWSAGGDPNQAVPLAFVVSAMQSTRKVDNARVDLRAKTSVSDPAPSRRASIRSRWGRLVRCVASKHNLRRAHGLPRERTRRVDVVFAHLNSLVDSLSAKI